MLPWLIGIQVGVQFAGGKAQIFHLHLYRPKAGIASRALTPHGVQRMPTEDGEEPGDTRKGDVLIVFKKIRTNWKIQDEHPKIGRMLFFALFLGLKFVGTR